MSLSWSRPPTVVIGLGDPSLERQALSALIAAVPVEQVAVGRRCMTAAEVLACLQQGDADGALIGTGLQGLGTDAANDLRDLGRPLVVLAAPGGEDWWREHVPAAHVLTVGRSLDAALVRRTLSNALGSDQRSRPHSRPRPTDSRLHHEPALAELAPTGRLVGVLGSPGGPGVTTTAINLAVLLGRQASTLLVDLRVGGASVAACLDLDSRRNVYMVGYAAPQDPAAWQRAFDLEIQPAHPSSPHGSVLTGLPPTLPGLQLGRLFAESLLYEALSRWAFVVVDAGVIPLAGAPAGLERVVLGAAHELLVISACDLVSLQRTQVALEQLQALGEPPAGQRRLLVGNRHDARYHHDRAEISRVLDAPLVALVPEDRHAAQRALSEQQPLVCGAPRSRAARGFAEVASVLSGGPQAALMRSSPAVVTQSEGRRRWLPTLGLAGVASRWSASVSSRAQARLR